MFQSTHPHGVRHSDDYGDDILGSFNPRTRMGCDYMGKTYGVWVNWFQSTHPHGVRPFISFSIAFPLCFNPRTRMGCDLKSLK